MRRLMSASSPCARTNIGEGRPSGSLGGARDASAHPSTSSTSMRSIACGRGRGSRPCRRRLPRSRFWQTSRSANVVVAVGVGQYMWRSWSQPLMSAAVRAPRSALPPSTSGTKSLPPPDGCARRRRRRYCGRRRRRRHHRCRRCRRVRGDAACASAGPPPASSAPPRFVIRTSRSRYWSSDTPGPSHAPVCDPPPIRVVRGPGRPLRCKLRRIAARVDLWLVARRARKARARRRLDYRCAIASRGTIRGPTTAVPASSSS